MNMKSVYAGAVLLAVVVAGAFFLQHDKPSLSKTGALSRITTPSPSEFEARTFYESSEFVLKRPEGIHARHVDETYAFSFELFEGFRAGEGQLSDGKHAVAVENDDGVWMLILATPFTTDLPVLTKERIRIDAPDLAVSNETPFAIAGVTGLLFDSDDQLWEGNARELWFVKNNVLYQLSTSRTWAPLLEETARSWRQEW